MSIYIISFLLNMLIGRLVLGNKPSQASSTSKIAYLIFTTIYLGLLCGFRDLSVGWDTNTYYDEFMFRLPNNWNEYRSYRGRLEPGFVLFSLIVKLLGGGYQDLLIASSLFIVGSACLFIYRHSTNVLLSVFILLCFPYYYSSFDIVRHFMATSFILLGYKYVLNRSLSKYLFFVLFAFLFQRSSVIFMLLYVIPNLKFNKRTLVVSLLCTVIAYFGFDIIMGSSLFSFLGYNMSSYEGWFDSDAGGTKTSIMYFAVFLIAYFAYKNLKNRTSDDEVGLLYVLFLFLFSIVFTKNRMIIRFIMSFIAFLAVYMPLLLVREKAKSKQQTSLLLSAFVAIGLVFHAFMLLTSWQKVVPYTPYWESSGLYY
ncbi:MAG: EpsG family protein [Bacteroidaceae bacterium]|nr:EpsG family protein [Bacteroidaceae bacterium]